MPDHEGEEDHGQNRNGRDHFVPAADRPIVVHHQLREVLLGFGGVLLQRRVHLVDVGLQRHQTFQRIPGCDGCADPRQILRRGQEGRRREVCVIAPAVAGRRLQGG